MDKQKLALISVIGNSMSGIEKESTILKPGKGAAGEPLIKTGPKTLATLAKSRSEYGA